VQIDIAEVQSLLKRAGVEFEPGLTAWELRAVEERFEIQFNESHRALLGHVLPVGDRWVDWRAGDPGQLRDRLDWPIDGVVFDVHNAGFWPRSWGPRPAAAAEAEDVARRELANVPRLVPVYSHRYMPPGQFPPDSPVFSVYQTDVIIYGDNLLDYVAHEFGPAPVTSTAEYELPWIPFWSSLVAGIEDDDLSSSVTQRSK
jgi:hypothetical protein